MVIYMQVRLRPLGMPQEEKKRWTHDPEEAENRRCPHFRLWGRSFFFPLAFLGLATGMLATGMLFLGAFSRDISDGLKWVFVVLPTILCIVLEYMIRKARRPRSGGRRQPQHRLPCAYWGCRASSTDWGGESAGMSRVGS